MTDKNKKKNSNKKQDNIGEEEEAEKESLRLEDFCGGRTQHEIVMEDCEDPNPRICKRAYDLYVPHTACEADEIDVLPLVFVLPSLDCPSNRMFYWEEISRKYNFLLVIPRGLGNSFNAETCCGQAMAKHIDDVGFFKEIIANLSNDFNDVVHKDLVYGHGIGNGGYMVAHAADLFRAIAPVNGYEAKMPTPNHPVSMFMYHGAREKDIQITGCCSDPDMPKCESNVLISDQCTSAYDYFQNFGKEVNQCDAKETLGKPSFEYHSASCYEIKTECKAKMTYCEDKNGAGFGQHPDQFPMSEEIAEFFAQDACSLDSGKWNTGSKHCDCQDTDNTAPYCVSKKWFDAKFSEKLSFQMRAFSEESEDFYLENQVLVALVAAGLAILVLGVRFCRRESAEERKYRDFARLPTVELTSIEENDEEMERPRRPRKLSSFL